MFRRSRNFAFLPLALLLAAAVIVGCSGDGSSESAGKTSESTEAPAAAKSPEAPVTVEAKLAAADALDGKVDKIVVRCASCSLGMDGKAENALETAGYTMYFCSPGCKERFGKDLDTSLAAMKIPAK